LAATAGYQHSLSALIRQSSEFPRDKLLGALRVSVAGSNRCNILKISFLIRSFQFDVVSHEIRLAKAGSVSVDNGIQLSV
jgi:hypothetical protein